VRSALAVRGRNRSRHNRFLEPTGQLHGERIQDATGPLDGDSVVLVSLVARHLRLVNAQSLRELPLGQSERDAERHEHVSEPVEVRELPQVSAPRRS